MEKEIDVEVQNVPASKEQVPTDFLSFLASTTDNECSKLYTLAVDALTFSNKVNIYHWSCKSGFQHTHFEEVYKIIRDFADKLVETVMSMGYEFKIESKTYLINGELFDLEGAIMKLEAFRDELVAKKQQYSTKISLENLFGDTIEALDKEIGLLKNFS